MKPLSLLSAVLLVPAGVLVTGCQVHPDMQRCVDSRSIVVPQSDCVRPSVPVHVRGSIFAQSAYHPYYGGYGNFEVGSKAWGGSDRPLAGHVYRSDESATPREPVILDREPQPYVSRGPGR